MEYGTLTENIYLNKPAKEDKVLIDDLNKNSDVIDANISSLSVLLNSKAPVENATLYGNVQAQNPDGTGVSKVATIEYIQKQVVDVKEIIAVNTRNDLPEVGNSNNIYLIKEEQGHPELIWNGSEYIENI